MSTTGSSVGSVLEPLYTSDTPVLARRAFWGAVLTLLTFGIYRFWMKTGLRQYYWNAIRIDDEPLEYTGRPVELLLGFLMAALFLAVYLGAIALGFPLIFGAATEAPIEFASGTTQLVLVIAVLPLLPYAAYRSRRYLLSRTRWRGVRFGMELAAWGYAGRWMLWGAGTVLTLGLLRPVADYSLQRFAVARMRFGDCHFQLTGRAAPLYGPFMVLWLVVVGTPLTMFAIAFSLDVQHFRATGITAIIIFMPAIIAYIHYSAFRLRHMLRNLMLRSTATDEPVAIMSALSTKRIILIALFGYLVIALAVGGVGYAVLIAADAAFAPEGQSIFGFPEPFPGPDPISNPFLAYAILAAPYLAVMPLLSWLSNVLVSQPMVREAAETLTIRNLDALSAAQQREEAQETSAEGFADALDVGAF